MQKKQKNQEFRKLPGVDTVLRSTEVVSLIETYGRPMVTYAVRKTVETARRRIGKKGSAADQSIESLAAGVKKMVTAITEPSLKPVINAAGVALHTNLGRAPMGETVFREIEPVSTGYSNIEFDLEKGKRGHRNDHIAPLLCYLTGCEEVAVVNNNAAALVLALNTLAAGREVIISRGELIEIGGAFRIPEIMAAAGVRMVEIGTTNRTRLADYQKATRPDTAMIVKAHKSNYTVSGFTEEVSVRDLAALAHKKKIPFLYDIGSGLLRKPAGLPLEDEPDVQSAIAAGADLVTFSGDKLLGGAQAGIIAGNGRLVRKLAGAPLMRALRVGKLTLAALSSACLHYLDDKTLVANNPLFALLERSESERLRIAQMLHAALENRDVGATVVESVGRCGGGTLPDLAMKSFAAAITSSAHNVKERQAFSERLFHGLLNGGRPVLGVLREGRFLLDVFALHERDIDAIAERVAECLAGGAAP
ncbi:MAG: L-seryl-tRNA(Sec) selenium transferase [Chitinispirillaceae bacterium]|nr:L-seryl-tRNA(Sec) selenium transferase [Chitinispirillaceae bacterium]